MFSSLLNTFLEPICCSYEHKFFNRAKVWICWLFSRHIHNEKIDIDVYDSMCVSACAKSLSTKQKRKWSVGWFFFSSNLHNIHSSFRSYGLLCKNNILICVSSCCFAFLFDNLSHIILIQLESKKNHMNVCSYSHQF